MDGVGSTGTCIKYRVSVHAQCIGMCTFSVTKWVCSIGRCIDTSIYLCTHANPGPSSRLTPLKTVTAGLLVVALMKGCPVE